MKTFVLTLATFLFASGISNAQHQATVNPHGLSFSLSPARTAPGTVEIEVGTSIGNSFDLPWIVKFTGDTNNFLFRNTEWSVIGGIHTESISLMLRRPLHHTDHFDIAVSPRILMPLEGEKQPLPGLAVLASYSWGLNGLTINGEINQTGEAPRKAVYGDYARSIGREGLRSRVSLFAGMQFETTTTTSISTGQGLAYRIRSNIEIEAAFRQLDLVSKKQFVFLTDIILNLGRIQ